LEGINPPKPPYPKGRILSEKKTKLFTMKVAPTEIAKWKKISESHDLKLAEMIRLLLENERPSKRKSIPKSDPETVRQLARIGNNLNQIARQVNSGNQLDVLEQLARIENQLNEILCTSSS